MKIISRLFWILIGAAVGFILAFLFFRADKVFYKISDKGKAAGSDWPWPDSLDAVTAAPRNHRIIYEDDRVRLLEVILWPNEFENLHVHKLPSVMFGSNNGDTSSFDIIYYRYRYDSSQQRYIIRDSTRQHSRGTEANEPDIGHLRKPEGPHAIKNLSNVKVDIYRLEFKK